MKELQFNHLPVGEISLAYIEEGLGAPVIFVHGGGATDLRTWGQQIEPFAERYRVIAYSQRYHYPNPWIGDGAELNSTSVHANDLANLITGLHLGRAHLIGSSFGAEIILRLAVDRPELVRTLVIGEPGLLSWLDALPGGAELFAEFRDTMKAAKRAVHDGDTAMAARLFIDAALGEGIFDALPPSTRDRIMDNARLIDAEPTETREMVAEDVTQEEAATIEAPTLVLTGDDSPEMYGLVSRELARHLPQAEQAQIEGAAHVLHSMNPQAYNATVLAFLAKHAG